ncbi:PTS sugar transporter subunit IIA [Lactobacillus sp. M0403]|uniref:PTS sugar transporter subunit IIA n=1 Tax=unclassified Lactobacillus TaxID=2620435 RepID=UPI000EFAE660|nr:MULTISPECIES: PTS sugar transporter subunit IIA [unclassified Lactobacillus]MBI0092203.1 PTS sugar transporter subunit IIA [Lactobacillus sp. M0403]RMC48350.1 PTS sugar transporter subunit IIA [Lactobacillus sp. ESL0263]
MFNIVIASHGPLAEAMKKSVKLFFPEENKITTASIDEKGLEIFQANLDEIMATVKDKSVLFLVDLSYGTPFNEIAKRMSMVSDDSEILSGVNMPTLIEAINLRNQGYSLKEVVPKLIEVSKLQSYSERIKTINNPDNE